MATLTLQSFTTLVSNSAAAVQSACSQLLDLTAGSVLRAILEASAGIGLWMQWLILQVLAVTRLATSTGSDVDSFVADFGLTRLAGTAATGSVTFGALTAPSTAVSIPSGTQVRTSDGTVSFLTTAAATLPAGAVSVAVPVQATTVGTAGNVQASSITLIAVALSGIDTVTNPLAFVNGIATETDAALQARFANFIATRAEATPAAVGYAVQSVQQGLTYTIQENTIPDGTYTPGNFVVTVNDGTGNPSATLLAAVQTAVNAVRPVGSTFQVQGPSAVLANISLSVSEATGYTHAQAVAAAGTAITAAVDACAMGATFYYGAIYKAALNCPSVASIESVLLNGGTSDLTVTAAQSVTAGTIAVS